MVRDRPLQALVIGEPTPDDWAAIRPAGSDGTRRTRRYTTRPPWRASRSAAWAWRARQAFDVDGHNVAIIAPPSGDGSSWLPRIIDAFGERSDRSPLPLLIIASDTL